MFKFCLISFVSGTRGAYLGHQLYSRYPELFSIQGLKNPRLRFIENYDIWHNWIPHFAEEIYYNHPDLHLANLFDSPLAQKLDKSKYNIILTHCYTDQELTKLYDALSGHTVKTLQITYDQQDEAEIFSRVETIFPNIGIQLTQDFPKYFKKLLSTNRNNMASNTIPVLFSDLKDSKNAPLLDFILPHFEI